MQLRAATDRVKELELHSKQESPEWVEVCALRNELIQEVMRGMGQNNDTQNVEMMDWE